MNRNEKVKQFVTNKLNYVETLEESHFALLEKFNIFKNILHDLIFVKSMGFRGVVATAIVGKYLNPNYNPLTDFYACNPRAIFENGIFYAFENRVPCGKSDPLNVAKNVHELNEAWARGKRPGSAARAAVEYLRYIQNATNSERELLIDFFFFKLVEYSKTIKSIGIVKYSGSSNSNQAIADKLSKFILEYPENGAMPQIVIHKLLTYLFENSQLKVIGGDSSVFSTNTTSKKPADIWIESSTIPTILFEITVKKIDCKRLDDCINSLSSLNLLDRQITFICRIPEDIAQIPNINNNSVIYKSKPFDFIDIRSFIRIVCSLLTGGQLQSLLNEVRSIIEHITRHEKTKNGWNKIWGNE